MSPGRLTASDRFLAVVYEYRYLALAGRAWNDLGPSGSEQTQRAANKLLPGIGVLVQDSLLLHARQLIDFYTTSAGRKDDVVLADFGLPQLSPTLMEKLARYKEPIEVHLLHMTMWRDVAFRNQEKRTARGKRRQRVDWNRHNSRIVDTLLQALNSTSRARKYSWSEPFRHLHRSAKAILADPQIKWPADLTEKADVNAYLKSLGLR